MNNRKFIIIFIVGIILFPIIAFQVIGNNPSNTLDHLELTVSYFEDENYLLINITNQANKSVIFSDYGYGLKLEQKGTFGWEYLCGFYPEDGARALSQPTLYSGEEVSKKFLLTWYDRDIHIENDIIYRIFSSGVIIGPNNNQTQNVIGTTEFKLQNNILIKLL
jgi:hypothetical protein